MEVLLKRSEWTAVLSWKQMTLDENDRGDADVEEDDDDDEQQL